MYSFASVGFSIFVPSSVIVSYVFCGFCFVICFLIFLKSPDFAPPSFMSLFAIVCVASIRSFFICSLSSFWLCIYCCRVSCLLSSLFIVACLYCFFLLFLISLRCFVVVDCLFFLFEFVMVWAPIASLSTSYIVFSSSLYFVRSFFFSLVSFSMVLKCVHCSGVPFSRLSFFLVCV